jgi:hypothetical protein
VLGTKADFFPPYLYFSKERGKEIVVALKGGGREDKMGIVQYMPNLASGNHLEIVERQWISSNNTQRQFCRLQRRGILASWVFLNLEWVAILALFSSWIH